MESFHIAIHLRPVGNWPEEVLHVAGRAVSKLAIPSEHLTSPLPVSFEQAVAQLESFPHLYCEPDGSFIWVSDRKAATRWQLDGQLVDRGGQLQYVELRGACPLESWLQLACVFSSDPKHLVVQLVQYAVWIEADEFVKWLP